MSKRGDLPRRPATAGRAAAVATCSHGRTGFCWDGATPEERERFDAWHRSAYTYAVGDAANPDPERREIAEAYACAFAAANYLYDDPGSHPANFELWRAGRL